MKRHTSPAQLQQRRLAWLLFITEGYIQNVNGFARWDLGDLPAGTTQRLNSAVERCIVAAERIRVDLGRIEA